MAETITLDDALAATAVTRTELDLTQYVAEAGPDWGDHQIEQYLAEAESGQVPVDFRVPNRVIVIPLLLRNVSGAMTFEQIRSAIQRKVGLLQREGGWITRTTGIGPLHADVINASLKMGGSTAQALWGIDADAVLTLTTLPDWYGNEFESSVVSSSAGAHDLTMLVSNVGGDYPARTRIIVTELDGIEQHGLMYGIRSKNYKTNVTARLAYEAEAMTAISPAANQAFTGASGGNEVYLSALSANWTPVLNTDLLASGPMVHEGSYRVWARVRSGGSLTAAPKLRFVWDIGDLVFPAENDPIQMPVQAGWWIADLGEIRLDPAPVGSHRWRGVIQAMCSTSGLSVGIDKVYFQPIDEYAGRLSSNAVPSIGASGYTALDSFDQTAGNLTGKTLPIGGTWTFVTGGDATDYTVDATNHWASRTAINDTAPRLLYASAMSASEVTVQMHIKHDITVGAYSYLIFRYVNSNNYGLLEIKQNSGYVYLTLSKVVSGTPVFLAEGYAGNIGINNWVTARAYVATTGQVYAWLFPLNSTPGAALASRTDEAATDAFGNGQTLASGNVGLGDYNPLATANTRLYNGFTAWVPGQDAVVFGNRKVELRYDHMTREAVGGTNYGPVGQVIGDLPRLPPAGLEGRPVEILLKPSSGNLDQDADALPSRISAQVKWRPSYLFVPEN